MFVDWNTIGLLWPEIILIAAATWLFVVGSFFRMRAWWTVFAAASYVTAGVVLLLTERSGAHLDPEGIGTLSGPLVADFLGYHLRWLALLVGLVFTLLSTKNSPRELTSELLGTLMLVVVGVMLTCRANDLVFLFVALEMVSIPTYVLLSSAAKIESVEKRRRSISS